jgi:hypothetical protein
MEGWLKMVKPDHFIWADFCVRYDDTLMPVAGVLAKDLKWFHELGIAGSWSIVTPGCWDMLKLDNYVTTKVNWDVNLKYEDILDDFCKNFYGPAAEPMKKYYRALDRAVQQSPDCFFMEDTSNAERVLTPQVIKEVTGDLQEAQRLAANNNAVALRVGAEMADYAKWVKSRFHKPTP